MSSLILLLTIQTIAAVPIFYSFYDFAIKSSDNKIKDTTGYGRPTIGGVDKGLFSNFSETDQWTFEDNSEFSMDHGSYTSATFISAFSPKQLVLEEFFMWAETPNGEIKCGIIYLNDNSWSLACKKATIKTALNSLTVDSKDIVVFGLAFFSDSEALRMDFMYMKKNGPINQAEMWLINGFESPSTSVKLLQCFFFSGFV